jgi:hypothetical protein
MTETERFMSKVMRTEGGCWVWTAYQSRDGYGVFAVGKRRVKAHRWSLENIGSVTLELGLEVDHLCRNRACVNPDHLEQVTHAENVRRGLAAALKRAAQTCQRGHEFTPENTGWQKGGERRYCRQCVRDRDRENQRRYRRERAA